MTLPNQEDTPLQEEIFSVTDLNRLVKSILESNFQSIWVKGEISNLAQPRSGHLYFTLKDAGAQVRCAMFRGQQKGINFELKEGIEVLLEGTVSLYTDRGDYQIIASQLRLWGDGQLQQAFEALKQKLQALGWFDSARKKPIPQFPKHIGIVTSPTGDALQDILRMLKERYPLAPVTVYPTLVQGKSAANAVANAIRRANQDFTADVVIVARGGGSLEDLWGFNEEIVAKAIVESQIPIVTGIGHEMDFTIADFVADLRAPTPTGAAQYITPHQQDLLTQLRDLQHRLQRAVNQKIDLRWMKLDQIDKRLVHPKQKITQNIEKLNHHTKLLHHVMSVQLRHAITLTESLNMQLTHANPIRNITRQMENVQNQRKFMENFISQQLANKEKDMMLKFELLNSLSPLQTLKRGFSITRDEQNRTIKTITQVQSKQTISCQFQDGKIQCTVETIERNRL